MSSLLQQIKSLDANKQNSLTAGTNITIDANNVISSTGGTGGGEVTQADLDLKQDVVTTATDISCNTLDTVGNVSIGGVITAPNQPSFNVIPSQTSTITGTDAGTSLPYDTIVHDSVNGYNTTTFEYTIQVAGDYLFYYSCSVSAGNQYATSLRKNNVLIERCLVRDTSLITQDFETIGGKGLVINRCAVGDKLRVSCNGNGRACTLDAPSFGPVNSFGGFLIG